MKKGLICCLNLHEGWGLPLADRQRRFVTACKGVRNNYSKTTHGHPEPQSIRHHCTPLSKIMFALIKTNGATGIAIHVPSDDHCATSLKQLALMLENNATFFQDNWSEFKLIEPEMSIVLGDQIKPQTHVENGEVFVVPAGFDFLNESFEIATTEVHVSYANAKKIFKDAIKGLHNEKELKDLEIQRLEQRVQQLEQRIEELSESEIYWKSLPDTRKPHA